MSPRLEAGRSAWRSASGGLLVDELGEAPEVVARRVGEHTVAEVEDVPWPSARERENLTRLARDHLERREHHPRVEVALNAEVTDPAPGLVERQAPVDAD